ncbi:MAG TPA: thioredoxin domain-containing protein [Terriglobales bacterium]|nr:thioredoxin domain-containing protein [Terriglobales bacterium]
MRKNIAFVAILVGLFDSVYLTWAYTSQAHSMVCLGGGCDVVRNSPYAYPFGIPLPIAGVVMYVVLAGLALAELHLPSRSETIWRLITIISGAGLLFSAWLTYLEAFVIHGWCSWCVVQAIAVAIVFALAISIVRSPAATSGSRRIRYALLGLAVAAGIPAMILLARKTESAPVQAADTAGVAVEDAGQLVRPDSHSAGNPNAKLTIVEFADFQCPACGVAERTNRAIRDQFGDRVRFVFRQLPLERIHAYAFQAAKAAECAGKQEKFWPMFETLYANQTRLTAPDLRQYASELGLDEQKFNACLEDPAVSRRIRVDMADANALDVRATPTFFLNGKKHEGPLTMMQVASAISEASRAPVAQVAPATEKVVRPEGQPGSPTQTNQTAPAPAANGKPATQDQSKSNPTADAHSAKANPGSPIGFGTPGGGNPFSTPNSSSAFVPCGVNEKPVNDPPMIQMAEMRKLFENKAAVFVDVRGSSAYKESHIPTAVNATLDQLEKRIPAELPKNRQIVLYEAGGADESCTASKTAGRILMQHGFKDVKVFKQGFEGWKQQGLPVAR